MTACNFSPLFLHLSFRLCRARGRRGERESNEEDLHTPPPSADGQNSGEGNKICGYEMNSTPMSRPRRKDGQGKKWVWLLLLANGDECLVFHFFRIPVFCHRNGGMHVVKWRGTRQVKVSMGPYKKLYLALLNRKKKEREAIRPSIPIFSVIAVKGTYWPPLRSRVGEKTESRAAAVKFSFSDRPSQPYSQWTELREKGVAGGGQRWETAPDPSDSLRSSSSGAAATASTGRRRKRGKYQEKTTRNN